MGITGTDVAKEAADMIPDRRQLCLDCPCHRRGPCGLREHQEVHALHPELQRPRAVPSAIYLLSGGAVPLPLTTMQILTIDLGTDMLPALGLGTEPPEADVMAGPS